jgi:hypothetical protein
MVIEECNSIVHSHQQINHLLTKWNWENQKWELWDDKLVLPRKKYHLEVYLKKDH